MEKEFRYLGFTAIERVPESATLEIPSVVSTTFNKPEDGEIEVASMFSCRIMIVCVLFSCHDDFDELPD